MRRRALLTIGFVLLLLVITIFVTGTISAPEDSEAPFKNGDSIMLEGEAVCLPHKDQEGPQTLECVLGFKDKKGRFYALRDTTPESSFTTGLPNNTPITIEGIFVDEASDKYQQTGIIELKAVRE